MKGILQWSEDEFFQWLRTQLEQREFMLGHKMDKEKMKAELYDILFCEQNLTVSEIEQYFIPFGQAGYLSPRCKLELMLYVLEKNYGESILFLKRNGPYEEITGKDVEEIYLQWTLENRMFLSAEDKKEFFVQTLMDRLGLGVLEILKRLISDGILIGELCPSMNQKESAKQRVAICVDGGVIRFPFLAIDTEDELIRIIKYAVALENRGELSVREPILDYVQEDGTCITAVRPPAGKDWGIRILYGAASKGAREWKK